MSDHVISFGSAPLPLRREDHEFRLVRPHAELIEAMRHAPGVRTVASLAPGVWSVAVDGTRSRDVLMDRVRRTSVAHHAYRIEDPDLPGTFTITDLVNVRFPSPVTDEEVQSFASRIGLRLVRRRGQWATMRVTNEAKVNPVKLCERLNGVGDLIVEPDHIVPISPFASFARQWHLHGRGPGGEASTAFSLEIEAAWARSRGSAGVVLATLDDGFALTNPDLAGRVRDPADFTILGANHGSDVASPGDFEPLAEQTRGDFHGTPCAGLAIARGASEVFGVAPGCSWMPVRFGIGSTPESTILDIFDHISLRADVVSCSWGQQPSAYARLSSIAGEVMGAIASKGGRNGRGLVICFAAGNHNLPTRLSAAKNPSGFEYYDTSTGNKLGTFFANRSIENAWNNLPGVLVVGAITAKGRKSMYSNWGADISVVAPSDNWLPSSVKTRSQFPDSPLTTTDNELNGVGLKDAGLADVDEGYITSGMGGTSAATPLVAGVCALLLSARPGLSAMDVRTVICETARRGGLRVDLDVPSFNNKLHSGEFDSTGHSLWFGHGVVQPEAALRQVGEQ